MIVHVLTSLLMPNASDQFGELKPADELLFDEGFWFSKKVQIEQLPLTHRDLSGEWADMLKIQMLSAGVLLPSQHVKLLCPHATVSSTYCDRLP